MAVASTPSLPSTRQHRWRWKILAFVVGGLVWIVLGMGLWFSYIGHQALPELDGSLSVPGLTSQVRVARDGHGFPTIEAANFDDLFFAEGYVTAQDRLWQMDSMRRAAAGELAEIFGKDLLKHDRTQRILGLRDFAQKEAQALPADERQRLEDYARGVNAFIASHQDRLPVEFRLLGYGPKQWSPEASLLIEEQMVEDLSENPQHALMRERILAALGPELTADLYVNSSWHDHPPSLVRSVPGTNDDEDKEDNEEDSGPGSSVAQSMGGSDFPFTPWLGEWPLALGSNNWVISGEHTVTGKPLLSNDMHLHHQMPNLWYAAHLRCRQYDVVGVTLPGVPYIIVGHNQHIAWGFTNVGPTVEDAYIETFNAQGEYLTPDGWKQPEHRREMIHVKGAKDVVLDVITTRHGPIFTDLVTGETRKLALRWTLYEGIHNPFFAVDEAQNWQEFRGALSTFDSPAQNAVYADVDGNIGYQATGKIPIRAGGDGSLPENGSDNAHEWTSYIPFDKLPSVYNPPSGIIATANGRITPKNYPYSISTEWEAPWRTERIYHVLESGKKFSAADMLALQMDIRSEGEHYLADRFVYAVDHAQKPSDRAKQAADILRQWDGRVSLDSAAPTIETKAREQLMRLLLEPKLGAAKDDKAGALSWKSYHWGLQSVWMENVIQHQLPRWLPQQYPNYDELLTAAVEAAVDEPETSGDLSSWRWGTVNFVEIQHPVLGRIPVLERWTGPGIQPQAGDGYTVKAATREHGPSERLTVDLADLDASTLNLVTGEAGNFFSPYYMDEWKAWYGGSTFRLPFSEPAVNAAESHELILVPTANEGGK
jgi:penicillin G amidase